MDEFFLRSYNESLTGAVASLPTALLPGLDDEDTTMFSPAG